MHRPDGGIGLALRWAGDPQEVVLEVICLTTIPPPPADSPYITTKYDEQHNVM